MDRRKGTDTEALQSYGMSLCQILDNAQDVAVMRQVLLQLSYWLNSGRKKVPLTMESPFNDDVCNSLYGLVIEKIKEDADGRD